MEPIIFYKIIRDKNNGKVWMTFLWLKCWARRRTMELDMNGINVACYNTEDIKVRLGQE